MPDIQRLTVPEFLTQLEIAEDWMLWISPEAEEIELIVKDSDGKMTAFHGPHPLMMTTEAYKEFAAEIETIADEKSK